MSFSSIGAELNNRNINQHLVAECSNINNNNPSLQDSNTLHPTSQLEHMVADRVLL